MSDGAMVEEVAGCLDCPFEQYNGGGHTCTHPTRLGRDVDRVVETEEPGERMSWCPLGEYPVLVRLKTESPA